MEPELNTEAVRVVSTLLRRYREDPVFFVEHCLGHKTWSKQREILMSVRDNERTAVRACHGSSKTYSAAEVAIWFLNCIPNSKIITTAPTFTQIKMLLWSEINAAYMSSRIELEGECLTTEIKTDEPDHFAIGFSTDKPARAEGWHAPAILFIFDEAKGIPQWLWDSSRGLMTGGFCRWLVLSTTDGVQVGEQYHKIFSNENHGWNRIHISAFDTPYVTGEKFEAVSVPDIDRVDRFKQVRISSEDFVIQIAGPKYIEDCRKEWGEDSVLFQTKVEGKIVDAGADSIIKLSQVNRMFANWDDPTFGTEGADEGGIDVARGGTDDTVFKHRKGMKLIDSKTISTANLPEKAKLVFISDEAKRFFGYNKKMLIKIDDTGVGGGVTDILQDDGYTVAPVCFGGEAGDPNRYPNVASEMWFEVGKIVHEIACPENNRLMTELVNRKSKGLDKKGRRLIESKDDYKARGFRSPDDADAFLLAFYEPGSKADAYVEQGGEDVY
jgi:phage terminase large subunit